MFIKDWNKKVCCKTLGELSQALPHLPAPPLPPPATFLPPPSPNTLPPRPSRSRAIKSCWRQRNGHLWWGQSSRCIEDETSGRSGAVFPSLSALWLLHSCDLQGSADSILWRSQGKEPLPQLVVLALDGRIHRRDRSWQPKWAWTNTSVGALRVRYSLCARLPRLSPGAA